MLSWHSGIPRLSSTWFQTFELMTGQVEDTFRSRKHRTVCLHVFFKPVIEAAASAPSPPRSRPQLKFKITSKRQQLTSSPIAFDALYLFQMMSAVLAIAATHRWYGALTRLKLINV